MQVTTYNIGTPFGVNGFIAAIIGGFGSAAGALAGGVLLGVLQAVAIVALGAGFKNVAALSTLLIVLFLFPPASSLVSHGLRRPTDSAPFRRLPCMTSPTPAPVS